MRILVTAGNTQVPIDRVRCITNVFTGRTGSRIAMAAAARGHEVVLLTSHPELVEPDPSLTIQPYQTYEELRTLLRGRLSDGTQDAVIHAAAVSDYLVEGVYHGPKADSAQEDRSAKIKSRHQELWLRLTPAPKLVDMFRHDWKFKGVLVKFKLEVGVSETDLLETAERSRQQSQADLMVANTLDGKNDWAFLGPVAGGYQKVARNDLAERLLEEVETLHRQRRKD